MFSNESAALSCFVEAPSFPPQPDYLEPAEASRIALLMRMNYKNMHLFRMSQAERNRCVEIILNYYRLHVPGFPEMKSLPVLQTLFR